MGGGGGGEGRAKGELEQSSLFKGSLQLKLGWFLGGKQAGKDYWLSSRPASGFPQSTDRQTDHHVFPLASLPQGFRGLSVTGCASSSTEPF